MTATPHALPLHIKKSGESFVVEDAHGKALAYVYFEDEPTRQAAANRLSSNDANTVARAIARALTERQQSEQKEPGH
jgi:hypothetical protein